MLVGPDIPSSPLSSEGLLRRYITAPQELGNSRRKKIKTTLPPGVREEQKGEEGEECALHWPCSRIEWQWGNVTGQQPGLLAINNPQGPKRLTPTAWSRGSQFPEQQHLTLWLLALSYSLPNWRSRLLSASSP